MAKRKMNLARVSRGLEICTPGCASSKNPHSINCKCPCQGLGHGVLYQAGLSDTDRARLRADVLGLLSSEMDRAKARFSAAPILHDARLAAGKLVRDWEYTRGQRIKLKRKRVAA